MYKNAAMRTDLPNQGSPDAGHLPQTVNLFLKKALPEFTVDKCCEAFIVTLRNFISFEHLHGFLWRPTQHGNCRVRLTLAGDMVSFAEEVSQVAQIRHSENAAESHDDLRVTLHRSVRTLEAEAEIQRMLEDEGGKAAIEILFSYYGRPALWIALGVPTPKQLPAEKTQELLLVFCHCALVSLHGAYHAELDEQAGKREKPEAGEQFDLALRWLHTVIRHLNVGLVRLQNKQTNDAEDALHRASIVAGVCLAELLYLMRVTAKESN